MERPGLSQLEGALWFEVVTSASRLSIMAIMFTITTVIAILIVVILISVCIYIFHFKYSYSYLSEGLLLYWKDCCYYHRARSSSDAGSWRPDVLLRIAVTYSLPH